MPSRRRKRGKPSKPNHRAGPANALLNAVRHDKERKALEIIDEGADVNFTFRNGKTLLLCAIFYNSRNISVLLDAGADVNGTDDAGKTALMYCAENVPDNNEIVAVELIKAGADLKVTDNQGMTALMYAAQTCGTRVVATLLDAGADVSITDNEGNTALIHFADIGKKAALTQQRNYYGPEKKKRDKEIISMLIDANTDLNATNSQGKTALMYAIQNETKSIVCALLDAGADHSVIDNDGQSALFFAAISGNESVVQRVIKAGADLNITDNQGKTVLTCAVLYGRDKVPVVAELIKAGVDVNITDNKGKTALIYCAQKDEKSLTHMRHYDYHMTTKESDWDKIANMLIEAGADVNITDNKGKTVLIYAVENNCEHLARALIDADGNVNIIDEQGKSALSYSIQTENVAHTASASESIACKLIKAGADVNLIGDEGKTPLMYAIQCNSESLVNALIEAGADVNVTDVKGRTALVHSLQSNYENWALFLIKTGANVNISDHEGQTALFYSLAHEKIVHALIEDRHATVNERDRYGRSVLFYSFSKSLTITNYLLEKGGHLNLKDNCSMSIISFFIEHLMSKGTISSLDSFMSKLNPVHRIPPQKIFEAIVNSVFCKMFHCMGQYSDIQSLTEALKLAKKYIGEQSVQKRETIEEVWAKINGGNFSRAFKLLVELGANPNYTDSDGNTALHYATCLPLFGPYEASVVMEMCHKLENLEVSFNAKNHKNETPLLFCLSKRDWISTSKSSNYKVKTLFVVCNYLLERGSSVNETTRSGKTVFHLMLELFQEGLHLNDERIGKEVLAETMKLLELFTFSRPSTEMTVNKRDANLNSPLHLWAMLELHLSSANNSSDIDHNTLKKNLLGSIFKHLVACGVRLNRRNKNEETPLHLCRSWTAVKLLIDAGANPKDLDSEGHTPLMVASKKLSLEDNDHFYQDFLQESKAFWKTVLDYNLDPWAVDNHGISVLSILIQEEAFDLSKALVELACEEKYIQSIAVSLLNAVCQDSSTCKQWKSILVEMILKSRKAKPISYKSNEDTALHLCCRNIVKPSEESVYKEEIFHYNEDEVTSVNAAKTSVHWTIVKQLLTYGMDCNALDASGQSCLDIANKCPALKRFLLRPLDIDEVPLAFPWTSISTKYKPILSKVARRQECKWIDTYWYHETNIQKGSFGLVFAGMNEKDGREVAIKRIEKLHNQELEADKKEIKTLIALADCEQVVRYLFYAEDEHFCYVILELMEGNLDDYLDGAAFDDTKSVQLCGDVLNGLKYLHQQNILHRDLKPSNILFKTYPKLGLKIADFGLSRRIDPLGTYTTSSGSVVGTRCWIAPEVLKFSSKKTKHQMACDVFSAGLVLYYILSGKKHPFTPADCEVKSELQISNETEANVINDKMESFDDSTLCPEATNLMYNMLDSDPTKRPTAAMALTHPFFWPEKKKMDFLSAVGNQPEFKCPRTKRKPPLSNVEIELDVKLKSMIMAHPMWNDPNYVHMPTIYTEMTKKRKYKCLDSKGSA